MGLTRVAQQIHNVLENKQSGLTIDQLTEIIKNEVSPYVKDDQIKRSLEGHSDVFVNTDSNTWRLKEIVEKEQRSSQVKEIISREETGKEGKEGNKGKDDKDSENIHFDALRGDIVSELKNDVIGPRDEDELLSERPQTYYLGGMLYPANVEVEDIEEIPEGQVSEEDQSNMNDEYETTEQEDDLTNVNRFQPSSIGLTCSIQSNAQKVEILIKYGKYEEIVEGKKKRYQRTQISERKPVSLNKYSQSIYLEDKAVECRVIVRKKDERLSLSVFLVNRYENDEKDIPVDHILFQPEITLKGEDALFLRRDIQSNNFIDDPDLDRSHLLYRNKADFAMGHGCAVEWKKYNSEEAKILKTTFVPAYEVPLLSTWS